MGSTPPRFKPRIEGWWGGVGLHIAYGNFKQIALLVRSPQIHRPASEERGYGTGDSLVAAASAAARALHQRHHLKNFSCPLLEILESTAMGGSICLNVSDFATMAAATESSSTTPKTHRVFAPLQADKAGLYRAVFELFVATNRVVHILLSLEAGGLDALVRPASFSSTKSSSASTAKCGPTAWFCLTSSNSTSS